MSLEIKFRNLKQIDLSTSHVTLAIIKEYKLNRVSQYDIKYVKIDQALENRLRNIIINKIAFANTFEQYTFDCPEPEEDQIRAMEYESTDFFRMFETLSNLNPEEDIIEGIDELLKAKSYLIVLRDNEGIRVVGFKTLPENWKLKKNRGLIPLLFKENRFEDLEDENVFSIANSIDFIYYEESLFILSKKAFEQGLNFREGMLTKANGLYTEVRELNLFINLEILISKVGDNQRYLRKIATIKNLGYYQNQNYLQKLQEVSMSKDWGIAFQESQIVITEDTLDAILTLLQNKRLHSDLTEEDFDVESMKALL